MHEVVLLGYGMHSYSYTHPLLGLDEIAEVVYVGAGWVANHQPGGKVDNVCAVLLHFPRTVLNVPAGATATGGVTDQFYLFSGIDAESTFSVLERSQAFASGARMIAVADDDSDLELVIGCDCLFLSIGV